MAGLQKTPKELHPKYFYDEKGSQLFDQICQLPDYYPTRTEQGIMEDNIEAIIDRIGDNAFLVEYGSGSSLKTRTLLDHLPDLAGYVPIDISKEHLLQSAQALALRYPFLTILPVVADYESAFTLPISEQPAAQVVAYFPGSTIGNFHPNRAIDLLRSIRAACGPDSHLLIGVDLQKEPDVLQAAYDDSAGVTAAFNLNVLAHLNREFGADFDLYQFKHRAIYNTKHHRIEMHLISQIEQTVWLADTAVRFAAGETIWTESSYKYTPATFSFLATQAGYTVADVWTDAREYFSVQYLIPSNLSPLAQELVDGLLDTRQREVEVLAGLSREQLVGAQNRTIEPPIWEMGHVGWFQDRWILQNLDRQPPVNQDADNLYDSFNVPNNARWDLAFPSYAETCDYITDVLNRIVQRLDGRELTAEDEYFYRLVINHEDMHSETMVHIRQTLRYQRPFIQNGRPHPPAIDATFDLHDVAIPGGTYQLGATPEMGFVLDNEKWAHPVDVQPFQISATPVTNAQYRLFVEAGGYQDRSLWSDEGWAWRQRAQAEQPAYWQREPDGGWLMRWFDQMVPLAPFHPMMHVNYYEANAYCAWAGRRLPTEAEWELAATGTPTADGSGFTSTKKLYPWGNTFPTLAQANLDSAALGLIDVRALPEGDSAFGCRQMMGNVWEWTADTFDAYPGFVIDPYDTYSAPSFGQQKVLRGGCWVTRSRVIRSTWRNFYTPDRNNIFAGFRTVAL